VNPWDGVQSRESKRHCYVDLFLIGFLILFFELASIRWFGSTAVFLTFFTNIVLLATFLGMSAGCLAASSRRDWIQAVVPLFLLAVVLACGVLWTYDHFGRIMVDVGGQGSPQQVYFGTEYRARDISHFVVPIELLAAVFFVVIAFTFIGLGQEMGRAFNAAQVRLLAYISNITGSLTGIVVFALASYLRTTPITWFAIVLMTWAYFLRRWTLLQTTSLIAALVLIGSSGYNNSFWAPYQKSSKHEVEMWSPYYKIIYAPRTRLIETNNIGHQEMEPVETGGVAYSVPHLLNRDSGGKPFDDVLVIGAGSGNDVQAALAHGAKHVDAVEIDPAIYDIGRAEHPDHPYQDLRVTVYIDDGRSFVRKTTRQYDLVVYALVDSLMLYSGYSSLRLESFLFTQQAFDDISARLKPGGLFVVSNFFRQGWIVGRIDKMAEKAFGSKPLVISLPYVDSIRPEDSQASRFTLFLAGRNAPIVAAILRQFDERQSFWINRKPGVNRPLNGFGPRPPVLEGSTDVDWNRIAPAMVDTRGIDTVPSDDWPFLYLRERAIPALNMRSVTLIAVLSLVILFVSSPVRRVRPNWQMFFLGAGFMLLETKAVVHMALLFGSTWIVNSVVFFAILVMILASNAYVLVVKPKRLWPYYSFLAAALIVDIVMPMNRFLALPGWQKVAGSCAVIFVPIFFAGIVFGTLFRDSSQPNIDFGSNIAGAIMGGLSESLTLMIGFNYLLVTAFIFYLLSGVVRPSVSVPPAVTTP
jgi:SAM-dependent methyltransferase